MAIPPAPGADGDSNLLFSVQDSEGLVPKHEALALGTVEVLATPRIVIVKEHCAGVLFPRVSDQPGHGPLVQVDGILSFGGK
jgi:hypothetical protein